MLAAFTPAVKSPVSPTPQPVLDPGRASPRRRRSATADSSSGRDHLSRPPGDGAIFAPGVPGLLRRGRRRPDPHRPRRPSLRPIPCLAPPRADPATPLRGVSSSTAAVVFRRRNSLASKGLRRCSPGLGRRVETMPPSECLFSRRWRAALENSCCCRSRRSRPNVGLHSLSSLSMGNQAA
jgi:hypothetical protein